MDYKNEKLNYLKSLKDMKRKKVSKTGFFFFAWNLILSLKSLELYLNIRFIFVPSNGTIPLIIKGCLYY